MKKEQIDNRQKRAKTRNVARRNMMKLSQPKFFQCNLC